MINYELVNYCEFDKYAKKSYSVIHNEPESKNLGDITKVNEKEISDFNWMVGGSPCQDFSIAGKGKGAVWTCMDCKDDEGNNYQYNPLEVHYSKRDKCPKCNSTNIEKTRSSLVVEWLRILLEKKPNVAIYENVKNIVGKKFKYTFDLFIQELHEYGYNTYWKILNAKDYGVPQNRERVYLIIIKKELDNGKFEFPEGFDNGIRLKNILEKEVDEKYYISQDKTDKLIKQLKDKEISNTIRSGGRGSLDRHQWDLVCVDEEPTIVQKCGDRGTNNYSVKEISNTIPANPMSDRGQLLIEKSDNKIQQVGMLDIKGNEQVRRVYDPEGLSPTLNTMGGGNRQPKIICEGNIYPSGGQNGNVYNTDGIAPTLRSGQGVVGNGIGSNNSPKIIEKNELVFVGGIDTTDKWIGNEKELSRNYKEGYRVYDSEGIACCQKSNGGGIGSYTGLYKVDGCSTRTRNYAGQPEQLEVRKDELSNSITTVQKDSMALETHGTLFTIKIELTDGKTSKTIYKEIAKEYIEGIWSNWKYGNYSCDCNRSILLYGIEESFEECSEGKIKAKVSLGNIVLYNDLDLADITPQDDKSAIENISSEYQFAKDKCMEFYNKNSYLPEMFNPYNQAEITDIAPTQTTSCNRSCSSATVLIKDIYYRIRKLIPLECFRLMGFSDVDFYILKENGISDSQCYKMAGNSIVVDVLYYILLEINKSMPYLLEDIKLSSFFSGIGAFEKAIKRLQETVQ